MEPEEGNEGERPRARRPLALAMQLSLH